MYILYDFGYCKVSRSILINFSVVCWQTATSQLANHTVTMSAVEEATSAVMERRAANSTVDDHGPSAWAAAVGSTVMLVFFAEGVVGTCWILVALLKVAELRRSVVNVFVIYTSIPDGLPVYKTLAGRLPWLSDLGATENDCQMHAPYKDYLTRGARSDGGTLAPGSSQQRLSLSVQDFGGSFTMVI